MLTSVVRMHFDESYLELIAYGGETPSQNSNHLSSYIGSKHSCLITLGITIRHSLFTEVWTLRKTSSYIVSIGSVVKSYHLEGKYYGVSRSLIPGITSRISFFAGTCVRYVRNQKFQFPTKSFTGSKCHKFPSFSVHLRMFSISSFV